MEGVCIAVTINTVIEEAQKLHPDSFPDSLKARWLSELDGKIMSETMLRSGFVPYQFPKDADKELLVESPYDNIYALYIIAMSDFFSGEMENYAVSAALFDTAYAEFRKNYLRNHIPPLALFQIAR